MFGFGDKKKEEIIESYVGLDIGTYAVKVLQLRKDIDQIHLETYGELEIAAYDSLAPGSITNLGEDKMIIAIRDLFSASKISSGKVNFSIPMQDCFISSISVPKVSENELKSLVPIEARKYLPVPITEVKLNYWKVDNEESSSDQDTIILAAVKNETIELFTRYAEKLNLKDFSFEIESLSSARAILNQFNNEKIPILHIDIGGKNSSVTLIHEGIVKATNLIQKGSYDITSQISKILSIGIDVAEEAKRIFGYKGDDSSPHLGEVMTLASYPLFDEVKHLLLQHERKYNINIDKVVLSGGGTLQKGIKNLISEFLERDIILADPFSSFILPENLKSSLKEEDRKYTVVAGLAMRNIFN